MVSSLQVCRTCGSTDPNKLRIVTIYDEYYDNEDILQTKECVCTNCWMGMTVELPQFRGYVATRVEDIIMAEDQSSLL
jgi:hypothetical protein